MTGVKTFYVKPAEASFIKYGINSFLMTKVLFWNQYSELCNNHNVDYNLIKEAIGTDVRIGSSHMNVPGHDGRRGSSSACFGKDVPAMIQYSEKSLSILLEAWNENCDIRNSYAEPLPREKEQHITFNKL